MRLAERIKAIFKGEEMEINSRGNTLKRAFYPKERYFIDMAEGFIESDWEQFDTDQDAHYFGFWVNPVTMQTLCYCEGDWTLCTCKDKEHYNSEIEDAIKFYGEGYEFKTLGDEGWTEYRQDREKFLIK